jgi:hypothetical protein
MLTGSACSLLWLFFVQEKTAGSLQICKILFHTTSIVKDGPLKTLSMVDAIVVALPLSVLAAFVTWGLSALSGRAKQRGLSNTFTGKL